jgi:hypothetical protein
MRTQYDSRYWRAMYEGAWEEDYQYSTWGALDAVYDPVRDVWYVPDLVEHPKPQYEFRFHGSMEENERPTGSRTRKSTGMEIVPRK